MTDTNEFNVLKMPKLPKDAAKYIKAAADKEGFRPYLTWIHAQDGYLYSADGVRVHIIRTGSADQGRIKLSKSLPGPDTWRVWEIIKPFIDEPRISATMNAGELMDQAKGLIDRSNPNRHRWFEAAVYLDTRVISLIPTTRDHRAASVVPLISRGNEAEGLKANLDIRYFPSLLLPFDREKPLAITIPYHSYTPFRFQQGDFISLLMPIVQ